MTRWFVAGFLCDNLQVDCMKNKDGQSNGKKRRQKKTAVVEESTESTDSTDGNEYITTKDMYAALEVLKESLASRDKVVDLLQYEIELNQQQIEQNKEILARRGTIYKLIFLLLAIGVLAVGFDQHSIIKTFETDMNNISGDMAIMTVEMIEMRKSMTTMSEDIDSMSKDFRNVARDVNGISRAVHGMSYDTRQMNRTMNSISPPWK